MKSTDETETIQDILDAEKEMELKIEAKKHPRFQRFFSSP